ncbi:site-specific DNA-methyltransferase [Candidatus Desantisbacteria bacterium]|nr:site-specific DNA-methyltransferase [Candidatus Desantisbacteria bacterium]
MIAWLKDIAVKRGNSLIKFGKLGTYWDGFPLNNLTKEGDVLFPNGKKPEALLQRILELSSISGDMILDSFLGSGSTAAVAHKMGRKYIGIEMGEHAYSHVHKRMKSVVSGEDQSGISKALNWKGGGGFKFYELAPSFITIDEFGNPVIDSFYNDTKLIRAMCKLLNYTFAPGQKDYWKHGKGQGNNSIYVTTQMLSVAMVQQYQTIKTNDKNM